MADPKAPAADLPSVYCNHVAYGFQGDLVRVMMGEAFSETHVEFRHVAMMRAVDLIAFSKKIVEWAAENAPQLLAPLPGEKPN